MNNPKSSSATITIKDYVEVKIDLIKTCPTANDKNSFIEITQIPEMAVIQIQNLNINLHDNATFETMFERLIRAPELKNLVKFPKSKILSVF